MARPKQFDDDRVLDRALSLFWSRGYAATGLDDLQRHTGLSRSSLYLAFGNKHALFLRCLAHYTAQVGGALGACAAAEVPAKVLLGRLFATVLALTAAPQREPASARGRQQLRRRASSPGTSRGCFLGNTALELGGRDAAVRTEVRAGLGAVEEIFAQVLRRGAARGELGRGLQPKAAARVLTANLHGMLVLAKAGASRTELKALQAAALSTVVVREARVSSRQGETP